MKVIVDISTLSMCSSPTGVKAGVYRVVEKLIGGLVTNPDVFLGFSATFDYEYAAAYLETNPEFVHVPLLLPALTQSMVKFEQEVQKTLIAIHQQIDTAKESGKGALAQKVARQLLFTASVRARKLRSNINLREMLKFDIFHATQFPIPEQLVEVKSLKKAINIYDIIPILFPEKMFGDHFLGPMIDSLDPETLIYTISDSAKNDICNYNPRLLPERVIVAHLAASENFYPCADPQRISATKKKYRLPDGPYIMCLCTLEPRKNLELVIRCFAKLIKQENITDLNLVLVGNKGWKYGSIFEAAQNSGLQEFRVHTTGYVEEDDLAPLYSGAMVFVFPSIYEGFGLPPLEAMQCGVPVITSNTSSLPEVVGDAGIMIKPSDEDALCQALLNLYSDSALRNELSLKSRKRAELFQWQNFLDKTIDGYKLLLSQ